MDEISRLNASPDTAMEIPDPMESLAPAYGTFTDAVRGQIRTVLAKYNTASLAEFSRLAGREPIPTADLQKTLDLTRKLAGYVENIREPDWEHLELRETIDLAAEGYPRRVLTLDVLPDGRWVTASENSVIVWSGGKPVHAADTGVIFPHVSVSPDGETIYYAGKSAGTRSVHTIDSRTFRDEQVAVTESYARLNMAPDGHLIITEDIDGGRNVRIRVLDPAHPENGSTAVAYNINVGSNDTRAVLHNGMLLVNGFLSDHATAAVFCLDPRTGEKITELSKGKIGFTSLAELPGGRFVIDGTHLFGSANVPVERTITLKVFGDRTYPLLDMVNAGAYPDGVSTAHTAPRLFDVTPGGRIAKFRDKYTFEIWNVEDHDSIDSATIPDTPGAIRITHDGQVIVASANNPEVYFYK